MDKRTWIIALSLGALVFVGTAVADTFDPFLKRTRYNPNHADITLGSTSAAGFGVPGEENHRGFILAVDPTAAAHGASADLTVRTPAFSEDHKITLSELGFDIFTPGGFDAFDRGSLCGAGLRFDFENSATGGVYSLNCNQGTHSDLGNGWTRIR